MSRSLIVALLVAFALLASCAGMRWTVFGGWLSQTGEIEGTQGGGPIDTRAGGPIVGVSIGGEITPPSPPRESPLSRMIDERMDERANEQTEPEGGFGWSTFDPTSNLYALVAYVVSGVAAALAAAKARNGAPPTE